MSIKIFIQNRVSTTNVERFEELMRRGEGREANASSTSASHSGRNKRGKKYPTKDKGASKRQEYGQIDRGTDM